ncbi:MAG TPA: signal peptidase I [Thermoanaerobaculia bacterium]|jgi:signal peptidase I
MAAAAEHEDRKSTAREYYEALLIAIIFVNFARIFVFQAFKIPSPSMEDNLKVGDHLVVNKFIYGPPAGLLDGLMPLREIERGDIIVFRYPENPDQDYVKRVIGLPGDTVEIKDKKVLVNGRLLAEPYVIFTDEGIVPDRPALPEPWRSRDQMKPRKIPEGQYFAMGDNRDQSADSRYWGNVPRGFIKGRPFMVYWSYEGAPPPAGAGAREHARSLVNVARNFFAKTRWHRMFFIVDSEYHYTPGIESYGH